MELSTGFICILQHHVEIDGEKGQAASTSAKYNTGEQIVLILMTIPHVVLLSFQWTGIVNVLRFFLWLVLEDINEAKTCFLVQYKTHSKKQFLLPKKCV